MGNLPQPRSSKESSTGQQGPGQIVESRLDISSNIQEIILFFSLSCSTMQLFAMVILLPFMCRFHHNSLTSFEIGILISSCTMGEILASRFTEPSVSRYGTKTSLQIGWILMLATSYAFWSLSYTKNDIDFAV